MYRYLVRVQVIIVESLVMPVTLSTTSVAQCILAVCKWLSKLLLPEVSMSWSTPMNLVVPFLVGMA